MGTDKLIWYKGKVIPGIHLATYSAFKKESKGIFIDFHTVKCILYRRLYRYKRREHYRILQEMEHYGLIRRVGSANGKNIKFELVGGNKDKLIKDPL